MNSRKTSRRARVTYGASLGRDGLALRFAHPELQAHPSIAQAAVRQEQQELREQILPAIARKSALRTLG